MIGLLVGVLGFRGTHRLASAVPLALVELLRVLGVGLAVAFESRGLQLVGLLLEVLRVLLQHALRFLRLAGVAQHDRAPVLVGLDRLTRASITCLFLGLRSTVPLSR